jgi:hypothetical protein
LDPLTLVLILGTLLFAFCALIFVVVAAIMIPIHIVVARRAGVSARFGWPGMATREGAVVANGARELLHPLTVGMNMIPRMQVTAVDPGGLVVLARRGWSWKSFGERIRVELRPTGSGRTEVQVESRSTYRNTLLDFGRNAENVSLVLATLKPQPSLR